MQVKSIAECSKGSILQYFRPSLSYHLSLRSLFCLFLRGRFTQVLLYLCFFQMADFLEGEFLKEQVESIKKIAEYVTQIKQVGPGLGEYMFDKSLQ